MATSAAAASKATAPGAAQLEITLKIAALRNAKAGSSSDRERTQRSREQKADRCF
jgi:hypothetical protein